MLTKKQQFEENYNNHFTVIPNALFKLKRERAINWIEQMILNLILSYQNFNSHYTSKNQISKELGERQETVSKAIDSLVEKGFISLTKINDKFVKINFHLKIKTTIEKTEKPQFSVVQEIEDKESTSTKTERYFYKNGEVTSPKLETIELIYKNKDKEIERVVSSETTTHKVIKLTVEEEEKKRQELLKKYSDELELLAHWNSKKIIVHVLNNEKLLKELKQILKAKDMPLLDHKKAIDNYSEVLSMDNAWFKYKWPLKTFLRRDKNEQFYEESFIIDNYKRYDNNKPFAFIDGQKIYDFIANENWRGGNMGNFTEIERKFIDDKGGFLGLNNLGDKLLKMTLKIFR